jgi:hypothetical protein
MLSDFCPDICPLADTAVAFPVFKTEKKARFCSIYGILD